MKFKIDVRRSGPGETATYEWTVHRYTMSGLTLEFLHRGYSNSAVNARVVAREWVDAYASADERALGWFDYTPNWPPTGIEFK